MDDTGSVAQVAWTRWQARPELVHPRFAEPDRSYEGMVVRRCPHCSGPLHSFRKADQGADRMGRHVASVCPACSAVFVRELGERVGGRRVEVSLPEVGAKKHEGLRLLLPEHAQIMVATGRQVIVGPAGNACGVDLHPGVSVRVIAAGSWPSRLTSPSAPPPEVMDRAVHWAKVTDPAGWPVAPAGADVRVILPQSPDTVALQERLHASGVPFRAVRYWVEDETVATNSRLELSATARPCGLIDQFGVEAVTHLGPEAAAARDAFDMVWQTTAPLPPDPTVYVPAGQLLPEQWVPLLSHPTLNPAQAEVTPHLLKDDRHVLVVAPTGAGKTTIGMVAALQTVRGQRRKAAWLVPQRSLTDELEAELRSWRQAGLRVERLSGEYAVDVQRVRDADVWVATTEKFEALCRAGSVRHALGEVGCLVVDEIHLLGDATRGPVLEALLARVRGEASTVRIVGLSATVANAEEIADWLGAHMVRVMWRPTRLTWQLPQIAATSDWRAATAARARLAAALTRQVTDDGGSVLVFCGSKHNVRATALAIAGSRGTRVEGIDPADLDRVHAVCDEAGVGLHYKDWPHKHDAERRFRNRELDVLVATTTVAAGVNLPARAVVVRDTEVGLDAISVATVQQMFGRAGRVGTGETEGYAYLICEETERPAWQQRLVAGYTVTSQILSTLPDHLLAEAVQGRICTLREAEAWWEQTLAHHQGDRDIAIIAGAVDFLVGGAYLTTRSHPSGDADITPTELGILTARLMVPTSAGVQLHTDLAKLPVPTGPDQAEDLILDLLAVTIPELAEAPLADEVRPAVARVLQAAGRLDQLGTNRTYLRGGLGSQAPFAPGDLAKAALKLCTRSPAAMRRPGRAIAGIPTAAMYPIWERAPRYLGWLAGQGYLAATHPWIAVVAADLSRRIRWRTTAPPRGAGRLLWMCEQMATPLHLTTDTPKLFDTATARAIISPDWTTTARPSGCRLNQADYTTLLRERITGTTIDLEAECVKITAPPGAIVVTWAGTSTGFHQSTGEPAEVPYPDADSGQPRGLAVFTRRGDYIATDWLDIYRRCEYRT